MGIYKELVILIAEDNNGHAELIQLGLIESGVCNRMIRFTNGLEVWEFLEGIKTDISSNAINYLLLLDLNMPIMDGIEVLQRLKSDDLLKELPVVILTTTDDPKEIKECYKWGCNIYVTKPVDFTKFTETLNRLGLFLQIVKV